MSDIYLIRICVYKYIPHGYMDVLSMEPAISNVQMPIAINLDTDMTGQEFLDLVNKYIFENFQKIVSDNLDQNTLATYNQWFHKMRAYISPQFRSCLYYHDPNYGAFFTAYDEVNAIKNKDKYFDKCTVVFKKVDHR